LPITDFNKPYLQVKAITATKNKITAKLVIDVDGDAVPKRKTVSVSKNGTDLYELSNERSAYRGYIVNEIDAGKELIAFSNGVSLRAGETHGGHTDDVMHAQIKETVREHFHKELRIREKMPAGQRMKVLSLFFIDRVANYYAEDGK